MIALHINAVLRAADQLYSTDEIYAEEHEDEFLELHDLLTSARQVAGKLEENADAGIEAAA